MERIGYTVHRAGSASEGRVAGQRALLRGRRHLAGHTPAIEAFDVACAACGATHCSVDMVMSAVGQLCASCHTEKALGAIVPRVDGWWTGLAISAVAALVTLHMLVAVTVGAYHPAIDSLWVLMWVELGALIGLAEGIKVLRLGHAQRDLLPEHLVTRVRRSGLAASFLGAGAAAWSSLLFGVAQLL